MIRNIFTFKLRQHVGRNPALKIAEKPTPFCLHIHVYSSAKYLTNTQNSSFYYFILFNAHLHGCSPQNNQHVHWKDYP